MKGSDYRHAGIFVMLLMSILLLMAGCASSDDDSGGSGSTVSLAAAASEALPAIPASGSSGPAMAAGDSLSDTLITSFFKLECHMPGMEDNCPTGITADDNTKYTVTTLIGVIYHAEMYMNNVLESSLSSCTSATVDAASFVTDDSGGDTSLYLIDFFDQLNCIGSSSYESQTQYFAADSAASGKPVMIVSRKHDTATAGWDQSDIFQAYLSTDSAGDNHILAFNTTNINDTSTSDSTFRTVLLVNLATRKFLVQHHGTGSNYLIAAGQGGISSSGTFESGYYFAKTSTTPAGICVDNATQLEAAAADCTAEQATWSSTAEVATYLDMTTDEQADLAGFLSYFQTGPTAAQLTTYPTVATDAKHIPNRIE